MKKIIAILLLIAAFYSCERDDICPESTPTTPHLVIKFFDIDEQSDIKEVENLLIQGINDEELEVYQSATTIDSIIYIPLRTIDDDNDPDNGITTKFILHKEYVYNDNDTPDDDTDDEIEGNADTIAITYTTSEVYVSRACGYKTIFEDVEVTLETDDDVWIELILFDEPLTVDNETDTHVQIYH